MLTVLDRCHFVPTELMGQHVVPRSAGEGDLMPLSSQITWISALGKSDCSGRKGYLGVVHTDCQRGLLCKKKVISLRENEFSASLGSRSWPA